MFNLIKYEFIKTKTGFIRSVILMALVMFLFGARIIGILMLVGVGGIYIWLSIHIANTFRDEMEDGTAYLYYSIPEQTEKKILAKAIVGSFYLSILLLVMLGTQYIIVDWNKYGFMSERTGLDMIKDLIPYNVEALGSGNIFVLIIYLFEFVLDGILSFIIAFLAISIRRSKRNIKESRMDNRKIGNTWIITYGIISSIISTAIDLIVKLIPLNYMPNGIDVGISFTRVILVLTVGMFMLKYTGNYIDKKIDI